MSLNPSFGKHSKMHRSTGIAEEMAEFLSNREVARIHGSAHFPHVKNRADFKTRLREFLQKNR
jgi:pimeloyl-ACP methyl ester carboxylesterase